MNNMSKTFTDELGKEETLIMNSQDDLELNMNKSYRLANYTSKKESKLAKKFKGSVLGSDIGIKSGGFSNIAILATVIAVAAVAIMYFMWRF